MWPGSGTNPAAVPAATSRRDLRLASMRALGGAVVLLVAGAGQAAADGPNWRAPRGWPSASELTHRIEQRLEHSLDDVALDVAVTVTRVRGHHVAVVATSGHAARRLEAVRCDELTDAVAVVVARIVADAFAEQSAGDLDAGVDVDAIEIEPPPSRSARVAADDSDSPLVDRGASPPATPATGYVPRPWTISARMSGVSGIGVIPRVGLGGELAVSVRAGEHLAELGASRWVASAAEFHAGTPSNVDVNLDATIGRYGWRPALLPVRAWLVVEVGTMHTGRSVAIPGAGADSSRWIATGAGFGIAWQMTPWIRLFGSTEAMVALRRGHVASDDGMDIYVPAPMSVRTTCGLEVGWQ